MNSAPARITFKRGPKLDAKLRAFDYQLEAIDAVKDLDYSAVFHEQGLGKTKIAIDVMLHWFNTDAIDTVLLVTKKTLVDNWRRELSSHSFITPKVLTSNRQQNFYALNAPARIVLTHFEGVKLELERLKLFCKTRRVAAVLDESARIKNPESGVTKAFFSLSKQFVRRMILTGTPVANRPYDIWAQIYFLDHGASLGTSFADFRRNLELSNDLAHNEVARDTFESELEGIFEKVSAFAVRETKDSGRVSLPAKEILSVATEWSPRQKTLYSTIRNELRASVLKDGRLVEDDSEDILKRLLRLVQVASNPMLVDEGYDETPGKFVALSQLVSEIRAKGEKVIVWTVFTENADWLVKKLSSFNPVTLHGKIPIFQRNLAVKTFLSDPECGIMVATPGAAKEGLTLTVANHVIFYDRGFSLDDYLQSQDRIHRVSQTRTCYVYNLLMAGSVDEWVDTLLAAKRGAARLAQGDIDMDEYRRTMTYSFGDILAEVLSPEGTGNNGD